jgi:hypothetical protein
VRPTNVKVSVSRRDLPKTRVVTRPLSLFPLSVGSDMDEDVTVEVKTQKILSEREFAGVMKAPIESFDLYSYP